MLTSPWAPRLPPAPCKAQPACVGTAFSSSQAPGHPQHGSPKGLKDSGCAQGQPCRSPPSCPFPPRAPHCRAMPARPSMAQPHQPASLRGHQRPAGFGGTWEMPCWLPAPAPHSSFSLAPKQITPSVPPRCSYPKRCHRPAAATPRAGHPPDPAGLGTAGGPRRAAAGRMVKEHPVSAAAPHCQQLSPLHSSHPGHPAEGARLLRAPQRVLRVATRQPTPSTTSCERRDRARRAPSGACTRKRAGDLCNSNHRASARFLWGHPVLFPAEISMDAGVPACGT